ncbi:PotD/PotF family extracellular solute-binding protein [Anaerococcus sp. DFU013_CI05]|uniref:ABC transporter substrate-binding protein n=1 Tax=unclassified Anaerococcus TaxID=2614126 RepID=UPI0019319EB4|nr:spermidine/putrescine ABC transporter substrate-binding protein [Anaerococcus sp. mt242]MBM0045663.1 spermidine/putrescine ABC transporter substrate-binding protein [Anaerococcus sp. mt242]
MKKKIFLMGFILLILTSCSSKDKNQVVVFNAGEYLDMDLIPEFEKETGIDVVYETFTSDEEMFIKLSQSSNNYDVIVPSDYMVERLLKNDMLEKIDFSNVPNFKYINEKYKGLDYDPKNEYTVPYFASHFGIVYNTDIIKEPITKWADLWNPKYKGEIIMYDLPRLSMSVALQKLGYSINTQDMDQLNEAKNELIKQKPLVYAYLTDEARDLVVQGDAAITVMYSGDALLMRTQNENLKYVTPEEGMNMQVDNLAIPKGAKNKKNAEIFINYFTDPKVATANAEWMEGFTSVVDGVRENLPEYIAESEEAYPDFSKHPQPEMFKDLEDYMQVYNDLWVEVLASY